MTTLKNETTKNVIIEQAAGAHWKEDAAQRVLRDGLGNIIYSGPLNVAATDGQLDTVLGLAMWLIQQGEPSKNVQFVVRTMMEPKAV